jgi:hypothetical protein
MALTLMASKPTTRITNQRGGCFISNVLLFNVLLLSWRARRRGIEAASRPPDSRRPSSAVVPVVSAISLLLV